MKTYAIFAATAQLLLTIGICNAQTIALKPAPSGVTIDGVSKEWGDDLSYTDPKTKINYTISNDKDNLYLVIKTKDPVQQSAILGAGVTFGVDNKGKKKPSYVVTFPSVSPDIDQSSYVNMPAAQIPIRVNLITKSSKIAVKGFKDISDDEITTDNSNGVKTFIGFDPATSYLTYEEAIPLKLFHADDAMTAEWAFNIKLNAVQGHEKQTAPQMRHQPTPVDGNISRETGGSADYNGLNALKDLTREANVTGKFTLAKAQ